jgi:DNA-binding NarL/FixJ family response regulator
MRSEKIRVLVVDDHQQVRVAITTLLATESDIVVVGEAGDGERAIEQTKELRPHVVLMDVRMPGMDGLEATRRLKQIPDSPRVLIITQHDNVEYFNATWGAGGDGFLSKKHLGSDLVRAIRSLVEGGSIAIMGE